MQIAAGEFKAKQREYTAVRNEKIGPLNDKRA